MLKPMAPEPGVSGDQERYRKDMVSFYASPENWGWSGSMGPKPMPEKMPDGRMAYRERGVLKYLDTGEAVEIESPKAPDPPISPAAHEPQRRGKK